jgi:hypothetical protein
LNHSKFTAIRGRSLVIDILIHGFYFKSKMNLNDTIHANLIDYAEHLGACKEALDWLRAAPRTWRELITKSSNWAGWIAAYIFVYRGDYEAVEKLSDGYWLGECAVEAARMGNYDQANRLADKSSHPAYWRSECIVAAANREEKPLSSCVGFFFKSKRGMS